MDIGEIGKGPKKELPEQFKSLKSIRDFVIDKQREFYKQSPDGDLPTMIILVCKNGDIASFVTLFTDANSSEHFCQSIKPMMKVWGVETYVIYSEAWVAAYDTQNPLVEPSKREDRKEVILTTVVSITGEKLTSIMEIIRDWTGNVVDLQNTEYSETAGMQFVGRFAELFE